MVVKKGLQNTIVAFDLLKKGCPKNGLLIKKSKNLIGLNLMSRQIKLDMSGIIG